MMITEEKLVGWTYTKFAHGNINSSGYHTTPHLHETIYNAQYSKIKLNHPPSTNAPLGDMQ